MPAEVTTAWAEVTPVSTTLLVAGALGTTTVTRAASAVATPAKLTAAPAGPVGENAATPATPARTATAPQPFHPHRFRMLPPLWVRTGPIDHEGGRAVLSSR